MSELSEVKVSLGWSHDDFLNNRSCIVVEGMTIGEGEDLLIEVEETVKRWSAGKLANDFMVACNMEFKSPESYAATREALTDIIVNHG